MSAEILEVAIATIDERTTALCVDVNGQVQVAGEPFQTLGGSMDRPPFHSFCRTMIDGFTPGLYDLGAQTRKSADEVIRRGRTKWGKDVANSKKLRQPATPEALPRVGTPAQEALRQGTKSLDDVPDEWLKQMIDDVPERFVVTNNGGGISETLWVDDVVTGKKYILKRGQYHMESVNEVITSRVQRAMGQDFPLVRYAETPKPNGWILIEHVDDIAVNEGWSVVGTAPGHGRIAGMAIDQFDDPNDPMRILMNDFLMDGADRKGGNILRMAKEGVAGERWVPIDNSLSLMGWRNAGEAAGDWSLAARRKIEGMRQYMKTRGSPKGIFGSVKKWGDDVTTKLYDDYVRALDDKFDDVLAVIDDLRLGASQEIVDHLDEVESLMRKRAELLHTKRGSNLRSMGVKHADDVVPSGPVTQADDITKALDEAYDAAGIADDVAGWQAAAAAEEAKAAGGEVIVTKTGRKWTGKARPAKDTRFAHLDYEFQAKLTPKQIDRVDRLLNQVDDWIDAIPDREERELIRTTLKAGYDRSSRGLSFVKKMEDVGLRKLDDNVIGVYYKGRVQVLVTRPMEEAAGTFIHELAHAAAHQGSIGNFGFSAGESYKTVYSFVQSTYDRGRKFKYWWYGVESADEAFAETVRMMVMGSPDFGVTRLQFLEQNRWIASKTRVILRGAFGR